MRRSVTVALVTIVLCYLAICAAVWAFQEHLVYFPDKDVPPPAMQGLQGTESLDLAADDGSRVHAWFQPARGANAAPRALVVLFHGNAGNLSHRGWKLDLLAKAGFASVVFDYRGYGKSGPGPITEAGLCQDGLAAARWAFSRARGSGGAPNPERAATGTGEALATVPAGGSEMGAAPGVGPGAAPGSTPALPVLFWGESLGCAIAVETARTLTPTGMLLEAPFTALADVGAVHYGWLPVRLLTRPRYDNLSKVKALPASLPLAVLHGEADRTIPCAQGKALHDASPALRKRLLLVPAADHNEAVYFDRKPLLDGLAFLLESSAP